MSIDCLVGLAVAKAAVVARRNQFQNCMVVDYRCYDEGSGRDG